MTLSHFLISGSQQSSSSHSASDDQIQKHKATQISSTRTRLEVLKLSEVRERLGQLHRVLALLCLVVILCKGFSRLQLCERLTQLNTCRSSLCSLVLFRAEARQQTAAVRHDAGEDGTR